MDCKEKILSKASERFLRDGFYKVTMNEIAADLRISKKTIYKYFPAKELLVNGTIDFITGRIKTEVEQIIDSDENSVVKFCMLLDKIWSFFIRIGDKWFRDLNNFMPEAWKRVDEFRSKMIFKNFTRLIEQGKSEKLILDYPTPIILNVFLNSIRATVNPEFVINNNFSLYQAAENTFEILLNGILTEKGKKIHRSFKQRNKQ